MGEINYGPLQTHVQWTTPKLYTPNVFMTEVILAIIFLSNT